MVFLVLGPNGSGKSAYAERIAAKLSSCGLYYVATMIPYGGEGRFRVEKHRKQREALGFTTIEKPFNVSDIPVLPDDAVLLEDVSNLLSNALFSGNRSGGADSVFSDITELCGKCRACVIVSIDGLTVKPEYNDETRNYIDALNRLNNRLCAFAEIVVSMRGGQPAFIKGELLCAGLGE